MIKIPFNITAGELPVTAKIYQVTDIEVLLDTMVCNSYGGYEFLVDEDCGDFILRFADNTALCTFQDIAYCECEGTTTTTGEPPFLVIILRYAEDYPFNNDFTDGLGGSYTVTLPNSSIVYKGVPFLWKEIPYWIGNEPGEYIVNLDNVTHWTHGGKDPVLYYRYSIEDINGTTGWIYAKPTSVIVSESNTVLIVEIGASEEPFATTTSTTTEEPQTTTSTQEVTTTTTTTNVGDCWEYGLLYNEYAFKDSKNIANTGFRIPLIEDFQTLSDYLGGTEYSSYGQTLNPTAGGKLKELTHWDNPNTGATNEVGFGYRGAGMRTNLNSGEFDFKGTLAYMRAKGVSSWNGSTLYSFIFSASNSSEEAKIPHSNDSGTLNNNWGCCVRLIMETPGNWHEGYIYVGNDGKEYRTVQIGTQVWVARNLAETKFRDGDCIPEVTDGTTWAGLSTAALCAYGNDWNNVGCDASPCTTTTTEELVTTTTCDGCTTTTEEVVSTTSEEPGTTTSSEEPVTTTSEEEITTTTTCNPKIYNINIKRIIRLSDLVEVNNLNLRAGVLYAFVISLGDPDAVFYKTILFDQTWTEVAIPGRYEVVWAGFSVLIGGVQTVSYIVYDHDFENNRIKQTITNMPQVYSSPGDTYKFGIPNNYAGDVYLFFTIHPYANYYDKKTINVNFAQSNDICENVVINNPDWELNTTYYQDPDFKWYFPSPMCLDVNSEFYIYGYYYLHPVRAELATSTGIIVYNWVLTGNDYVVILDILTAIPSIVAGYYRIRLFGASNSLLMSTGSIQIKDCYVNSAFRCYELEPVTYISGPTYPSVSPVYVNQTGSSSYVLFNFTTGDSPTRFIVFFINEKRLDTGYYGNSSYDVGGVFRSTFNNSLLGKYDPEYGFRYPDYNYFPDDGYPRVNSSNPVEMCFDWGLVSSPRMKDAIVYAYTPLGTPDWGFNLVCSEHGYCGMTTTCENTLVIYGTQNNSFLTFVGATANLLGQTFSFPGGTITGVSLMVGGSIGAPTSDLRLSLYSVSGGLPDAKIADSTNTFPAYNAVVQYLDFEFNESLVAGNYCFVLSYENVVLHNDSNCTIFMTNSSNKYSGGSGVYKAGGSAWVEISLTDLISFINYNICIVP
jgi:uncharacterized protein (TIGR02145 family)